MGSMPAPPVVVLRRPSPAHSRNDGIAENHRAQRECATPPAGPAPSDRPARATAPAQPAATALRRGAMKEAPPKGSLPRAPPASRACASSACSRAARPARCTWPLRRPPIRRVAVKALQLAATGQDGAGTVGREAFERETRMLRWPCATPASSPCTAWRPCPAWAGCAMELVAGSDLTRYTRADAPAAAGRWCRASARAWPRRWPMPTGRASCTATSSRPT